MHLHSRTTLSGVSLCLAVLGVSLGCSPADTSAAAAPEAAESSTDRSSAQPDLPTPFDYLVNIAQNDQKALHDAEEQAAASCMKAKGFHYTAQAFKPEPSHRQPIADVDAAHERGYGISDNVARGGLTGLENDLQSNPDLKGRSVEEQLAWTTALLGPPPSPHDKGTSARVTVAIPGGGELSFDPNSCASRARSAVYGDDARWIQFEVAIRGLQGQVYTDSVYQVTTDDPGYLAALGKWQQCMGERGFNYPRPYAAAGALNQQARAGDVDQPRLRALEIQVASADAECFHSTGLFDATAELMRAHEERLSGENQGAITEFKGAQQQAIARAQSTLSAGQL
jgi:hypothetical protein